MYATKATPETYKESASQGRTRLDIEACMRVLWMKNTVYGE